MKKLLAYRFSIYHRPWIYHILYFYIFITLIAFIYQLPPLLLIQNVLFLFAILIVLMLHQIDTSGANSTFVKILPYSRKKLLLSKYLFYLIVISVFVLVASILLILIGSESVLSAFIGYLSNKGIYPILGFLMTVLQIVLFSMIMLAGISVLIQIIMRTFWWVYRIIFSFLFIVLFAIITTYGAILLGEITFFNSIYHYMLAIILSQSIWLVCLFLFERILTLKFDLVNKRGDKFILEVLSHG